MRYSIPTRASHLPELRAQLVDDETLWQAVEVICLMHGDAGTAAPLRESLRTASLWWIGSDCCDLLEQAAPSMPSVDLTSDLVPDIEGFAFFGRPLVGSHGAVPGATLSFDCVQWLPGIIAGMPAVSILVWSITPDEQMPTMPVEADWIPQPRGRSDWPFRWATDQRAEGVTDLAHQSIVEDRRLIAAMWQLSTQRNLAETTDITPDRAARRRLERRSHPAAPVRLIRLNRSSRPAASSEPGAGRDYGCRWIVRAHWRQQAFGPGRSLRKAILVPQHIRGPQDKPLRVRESVKVWDKT
ncbi:MAG: hypothetical protein ACRD2C_13630 [Acidimicrobiales bacterium]